MPTPLSSALRGLALGDALGLPHEGLAPARIQRRLGDRPLRPMLLPGWMMVSDDTDHACMALGAWRDGGGDPEKFTRLLARRFRWWFFCLPPGIGLATAKAALRLWVGVSPEKSGVFSAGNGPLMRAGILGVALCGDEAMRREAVARATRLTHTDPVALDCAQVFAWACAQVAATGYPADRAAFAMELLGLTQTRALRDRLRPLAETLAQGGTLEIYREAAGWQDRPGRKWRGVSGFAPDSLAGALAASLFAGPDGLAVIDCAVRLGGDADSVASFAGCLAGAASPETFDAPEAQGLLASLRDMPWRGASLDRLAAGEEPSAATAALRLPRNLLQLGIVLGHGFLRPAW